MSDFIGGPYYLPALPITSADDMHICMVRFVPGTSGGRYIPAAERSTTGGSADPSLYTKNIFFVRGRAKWGAGEIGAGLSQNNPNFFFRPREGEEHGG